MRIGFNTTPPHQSSDEWGDILTALGLRAAVFPVDYAAPVSLIDAYVNAALERNIRLEKVGYISNLQNKSLLHSYRCNK